MTISKFANLIGVSDLPELRQVTPSGVENLKRTDKSLRVVRSLPNGERNYIYQYDESLAYDEAPPGIIKPIDNIGCWIMLNRPRIESNSLPTNPPDIVGSELKVTLADPSRIINYRCNSKSDPPAVSDWQAIEAVLAIDGEPTFTPDYTGQLVRDRATNYLYIAEDDGTWLPLQVLKGEAIVADKIIGTGDRNRWFNVSEDVTITLSGDLTKSICLELVIGVAGKTATLQADTATGAILVGSESVTASCRLRNEGNVWYRM